MITSRGASMRSFSWSALWTPTWPPWEVALRATLVYFAAQILFRLIGRKELSRYATHDILLLFLINSALRQSMVGTDTSLTAAFVALGTIVAWDALLSYVSFRSGRLAAMIEGRVRHLVTDGVVNETELARAHISRDELVSQLRQRGCDDVAVVKDAYLERSGQLSFILRKP